VAGAAMMPYARYFAYDVAGGVLWAGSMILSGYFLGSMAPNIAGRILYVIAVVILLSLLPAIIGALRARANMRSRHQAPAPDPQPERE